MDPQQAWFELIAAYHAGDWDGVVERADALLQWMQQVGFPSETLFPNSAVHDRSLELPRTLGDDWNRTVATAACRFARKVALDRMELMKQERRPHERTTLGQPSQHDTEHL